MGRSLVFTKLCKRDRIRWPATPSPPLRAVIDVGFGNNCPQDLTHAGGKLPRCPNWTSAPQVLSSDLPSATEKSLAEPNLAVRHPSVSFPVLEWPGKRHGKASRFVAVMTNRQLSGDDEFSLSPSEVQLSRITNSWFSLFETACTFSGEPATQRYYPRPLPLVYST